MSRSARTLRSRRLRVNDSTYTDTVMVPSSLLPHTPYWWRVRAGNLAGFSGFATAMEVHHQYCDPGRRHAAGFRDRHRGEYHDALDRLTRCGHVHPGDREGPAFVLSRSAGFDSDRNDAGHQGLEPYTLYYWRVKAVDARGGAPIPAWRHSRRRSWPRSRRYRNHHAAVSVRS